MTAPIDFGYDTSCLTALRTGRFSQGVRLVAEACYRRLTTPRGTLQGGEDESDYGLDLADMIGQASNPSTVAAMPGQIQAELQKDQRIQSCAATVTSSTVGASTSWVVTISAQTALGPFSLVLGVSGVTVSLLGLTA